GGCGAEGSQGAQLSRGVLLAKGDVARLEVRPHGGGDMQVETRCRCRDRVAEGQHRPRARELVLQGSKLPGPEVVADIRRQLPGARLDYCPRIVGAPGRAVV